MREREMLKVTKCVRVNSFVGALINMVCELRITSWSKKNCVKISEWSDIALRIISEKLSYAAMKYIVAASFGNK